MDNCIQYMYITYTASKHNFLDLELLLFFVVGFVVIRVCFFSVGTQPYKDKRIKDSKWLKKSFINILRLCDEKENMMYSLNSMIELLISL